MANLHSKDVKISPELHDFVRVFLKFFTFECKSRLWKSGQYSAMQWSGFLFLVGSVFYTIIFRFLLLQKYVQNGLHQRFNNLTDILGAAGSGVRISCSGDNTKAPTIAEEAVDQLQENEKLVAGKKIFSKHLFQNSVYYLIAWQMSGI